MFIAPDDVLKDAEDIRARCRLTWIDPKLRAVAPHPLRVALCDLVRGQSAGGVTRGPEGIQPDMQLDPACVCLGNRVLERIVPT
jgi:hypothetical protein